MRSFGLKLVTVFLISLFTLEIGLRLALGRTFPPRFFEPHADMGHFHIAGSHGWQRTGEYETYVEINAQGLRDHTYPYQKSPDRFRILVVGDSFVEGLQVSVEDTFPKVLETTFAEADYPVEVINAGVSRYGTAHVARFLEAEGLRYQPDLVIYALYPNDITDNIESDLATLDDNHHLAMQLVSTSRLQPIRGVLYDYSYLYRTLLGISILIGQKTDKTLIDTEWGLVLPIYRQTLHSREEQAWQLTDALLQHIADMGTPLLIVYLPEDYQVDDSLWNKVTQSDTLLDRDAPNTRLAQGIPNGSSFLDLTPTFRKVGTGLYYRVDRHFTSQGHALAAEAIYQYLLENDLIVLAETPTTTHPIG